MSLFHSPKRSIGFTLVELLVVITIIGLVSAMLSAAMTASQRTALARRTEAELLTYGTILQGRAGGITFTRLPSPPISLSAFSAVPGGLLSTGERNLIEQMDAARADMLVRRDFARMLMPNCQADLLLPPATIQKRVIDSGSLSNMRVVSFKTPIPPVWNEMRALVGLRTSQQIDDAAAAAGLGRPINNPAIDAIGLFNSNSVFQAICALRSNGTTWVRPTDVRLRTESGECLYLILATYRQNGLSAVDNIPNRNIGDTNGNGVNEILDPWGKAVCFIREPVGLQGRGLSNFDSSRAKASALTERGAIPGGENAAAFPLTDPDPYDLLGSDYRYAAIQGSSVGTNSVIASGDNPPQAYFPFYAPPVIISAGPDGEFGIYRPEHLPVFTTSSTFAIATPPTPRISAATMAYRYPNPYFVVRADGNPLITVLNSTPGTSAFPQIFDARRGGGLGGYIGITERDANAVEESIEAATDNITSIDGGL
jgi:prepilin-type N-terminal cleavage/methylation domain-containing protein